MHFTDIQEAYRRICESMNHKNLREFLELKSNYIRKGLERLERMSREEGFKKGLERVGYRVVVVPDEEWMKGKRDPTETSGDPGNRCIRIKESYLKANPGFFDFKDEYGWSLHEFAHAMIFSGLLDDITSKIDPSPFGYPMNTDEILAFGFQIMNSDEETFEKIVRYEGGNSSDFPEQFHELKRVLGKR